MSKLTRAARLRSCSLRLPGCTNQGVVFAHAPSVESGMGRKSPDWWGADACSHCHDLADSRARRDDTTRELITERWLKGIFETQHHRFTTGLLVVAD